MLKATRKTSTGTFLWLLGAIIFYLTFETANMKIFVQCSYSWGLEQHIQYNKSLDKTRIAKSINQTKEKSYIRGL